MGKKKTVAIDDDEYFMPPDDDSQEPTPALAPAPEKESRGKKNKKGVGGGKVQRDDSDKVDGVVELEKHTVSDVAEDEDDAAPIVFTGKKKSSKSKKSSKTVSAFSAFNSLVEDEGHGDDVEVEPESPPIAKVKPHLDILDRNGVGEGEDDVKDPDFVVEEVNLKKQQQKKKKKKGGRSAQEEEDLDRILAELGEGPAPIATVAEDSAQSLAERLDSMPISGPEGGGETVDMELETSGRGEGEEVNSKKQQQKKKKKKGGRTAQEEEDLEKILAELGEGSVSSQPSTSAAATAATDESIQTPAEQVEASADGNAEDKDGEAEGVESAAAKKKKKKKEKEKEKKAAAAAAAVTGSGENAEEKKEDIKGKAAEKKVSDKKIPKNVRQMQEALARRKEEEERKKREEEERLRKEEEERLRKEEEERLAEEAKRRKKEREKEKLLKKKQEGKLLTGKQKEEARRLEAMRNQFLARGIELPLPEAEKEVKKRPKYQTKKARPGISKNVGKDEVMESQPEVVQPEMEHAEEESIVEEESQPQILEVEEKEPEEKMEEVQVEEEDEEEWDAKSWDDIDVNLPATSAFAEEEEEKVTKPLVKKIDEHVKSSAQIEEKASNAVSAKPATKRVVAPHAAPVSEKKENGQKADSFKSQASISGDSLSEAEDNLRSPICCILGHVDTGKTKLLDCIRGTNVQEGEAGGITQQIGATYFPAENIRERTKELKSDAKLRVPGLLVIDTPGHESFTNLRSRGSSLCDIAILVVDIMHGLEPQTIESLNLLKSRKTEFIVALNKVDRLYGWKKCTNAPIQVAMRQQSKDVQNEFKMRVNQIITQFMEQGLNTELYYKNKDMGETYNIVPTSAFSGEGVPDLLLVLVFWAQRTMAEKLTFHDELECTVLEVKVIEGLGTTIDVVLVNGALHEGDQIVVCGMQSSVDPHPMKELRIKGSYLHHKTLKAAQGVKITAQGLEHAIAGTALYVVGPDDDLEDVKDSAMQDMKTVMSRIDKSGEGSAFRLPLWGLWKPCSSSSRPLRLTSPLARELADEVGVKIFIADIIYHLFDQFKAYIDAIKEEKKKESAEDAVFPSILKIMPNCVFNKKDPIILGVDVVEGILKVGTPICIPSQDFIDIGRIASIEINHKQVDVAKKGQKVAIKSNRKMFGRHFEMDDELVSHISRKGIDILKADYRGFFRPLMGNSSVGVQDELSNEEWLLVLKLKKLFKIP
ncbi:unnamed protein product [Spirodela intermedia]|uniref:Eukaryotic translation initiation factor 5B n=1 Tax=Spirodela intermedia TaxID=51605 RepID=A0A7I8J810_SPIIN|nr:unnamed protein product [Spirodela intermedia]CAA6666190.1 unnamed protein product [Spirodela intermedia]